MQKLGLVSLVQGFKPMPASDLERSASAIPLLPLPTVCPVTSTKVG